MNKPKSRMIVFAFAVFLLSGCTSTSGNVGQLQNYRAPSIEAEWIRNGEPIDFESQKWFPTDYVESLIDADVYLIGEYRTVEFFVEKQDVRPYNRLFTKFGKNKFRLYELRHYD